MLSFGELRNHLDILRRYMVRMNSPIPCPDQASLRQRHLNIVLLLLNFFLLDYSPTFYAEVLSLVPNIKATNDRKFVESALQVVRKLLQLDVPLTADQFLSQNKFLDKKIQFLSDLAKAVYERVKSNNPIVSVPIANSHSNSNHTNLTSNPSSYTTHNNQGDSDEQPIQISVSPLSRLGSCAIQPSVPVKGLTGFKVDRDLIVSANNPKVFPTQNYSNVKVHSESISFALQEQMEQFQLQIPHQQAQRGNITNQQHTGQQQTGQTASAEELAEVIQMMHTINSTLSAFTNKFTSFQQNVVGWVNNLNAKVALLEQNVKMIKDNL